MAARVTGHREVLRFAYITLLIRGLVDALIALTRRSMVRVICVCIVSTNPLYSPGATLLGSVDTAESHPRQWDSHPRQDRMRSI